MSGFTFNGISSQNFSLEITRDDRILLPSSKDNYIEIPGRDGNFLFPGKFKDRLLTIECIITKPTIAELRSIIREISAWLHSTEKETLEFDDEPGRYYMVKLSEEVKLDEFYRTAKFILKFMCDPLVYGVEQTLQFANDRLTLTNDGTYTVLPRFTSVFTSTASEWKVTLNSGKFVRIVNGFQVDDTLEVNCATGKIFINGVRALNTLDWQNSEFFEIPKNQNDLSVLPTAVCTTAVCYKPRWL